MKKKQTAIILFFCIIVIAIMAVVFPKSEMSEVITNTHYEKDSSMISMMLEITLGSGTYEASNNTTWPDDEYSLNEAKSGCENGGKIIFNEESKRVVVKTNISDKCYVYFDKYNKPTITAEISDITVDSFIIKANGKAGSSAIDVYYYSIDNGLTWSVSSSNVIPITGLNEYTTYNVKLKVADINKKESKEYSLSVKTPMNFVKYIKSLYTTDGENGLYYHDGKGDYINSNLEAGDNNYRYAGANPNNYVCFGSDANTCPNESLYRIIGVLNNNIKLIMADYAMVDQVGTDGEYSKLVNSTYSYKGHNPSNKLGVYFWNNINGENSTSNWADSRLNKINLNTNYINYLINIDSRWEKMIDEVTWNVGGVGWTNGIRSGAKKAFDNEIGPSGTGITTQINAKIGLLYIHEYYYASLPKYWSLAGFTNKDNLDLNGNYGPDYDYRSAISDDWLQMGLDEWTISKYASLNHYVFHINKSSWISYLPEWAHTDYEGLSIRPTFYLNANVLLISGTGTQTDPYRIF